MTRGEVARMVLRTSPVAAIFVGAVGAVGALASCEKPVSRDPTTPLGGPTPSSDTSQPTARRTPPGVPVPCITTIPIVVTTQNLTDSRGDLCAAFNQSIKRLPNTTALGAGNFEIRVRLWKLDASPDVVCHLGISVSANSAGIGQMSGGAKVTRNVNVVGSRRLAARDCIVVALEALMTQKVGPLMQQYLAGLPTSMSAGSGSTPTSPSPAP